MKSIEEAIQTKAERIADEFATKLAWLTPAAGRKFINRSRVVKALKARLEEELELFAKELRWQMKQRMEQEIAEARRETKEKEERGWR